MSTELSPMVHELRVRGLNRFPQPLPDEHVWSVVARSHHLSGNRFPAATLAQLGIQSGPLKAQDLFNSSLSSAVPSIARLLATDSLTLLREHSPLPVFELSMSMPAQQAWHAAWDNGELPIENHARPMNWRILRHDGSWRYCTECVTADSAQYGVSYWHATHQVPGLRICHRHGKPLAGRCRECGRTRSTLNDLQLPTALCACRTEPESALATDWDEWLCCLLQTEDLQKARSLESTLAQIRGGFGLPERITGKHRPRLDAILDLVESAMGRDQLAGFFEFYGSDIDRYRGRSRPHLVKTALTDSRRMVRHPLYFLALLYALDTKSGSQEHTAPGSHSQWDQHAQLASDATEAWGVIHGQ